MEKTLKKCVSITCALRGQEIRTDLAKCLHCGDTLLEPSDLLAKLMGLDSDLLK